MKTAITILSTIALLVAAPILAQGDGVVHSATGSGHLLLGDDLRTFSFTAVERSDGSVTGQAENHNRATGATAHVEIDCLNVVGNVAIISGETRGGRTAVFAVEDNGEGANASPDRITLVITNDPDYPTGVCMLVTPEDAEPFLMPIEDGNVQVR
ncbi:MAG: hypothetical protein ACRDNP_01925 [Gaiellaceae bacterium]